jgi:hypothetical protein
MGLTLMATGEHYFFDVLLGWMYAGSVMGAWAWWERRRERVTGARPVATSPLPASGGLVPAAPSDELREQGVAGLTSLSRGAGRGARPGSIEYGPAFEELLARDLATRVALFQEAHGRSSGIARGGPHSTHHEHDQPDQHDPQSDPHEPHDRHADPSHGNEEHRRHRAV